MMMMMMIEKDSVKVMITKMANLLMPISIRYGDTILDYTGSDVEVSNFNLRLNLSFVLKLNKRNFLI